ncbi:GIY-YIG catalytic domain-containing protein [Nocardia tenerifensis]|uniref:GIY-YIG catalytic domain-containing protein n=1 Tax=Nocardia tenerifensis TaxID=228006 RepID=A0A318JVV0_9NOCA|nr:GIY-YIG nuclease family protein [Nocardia tenerifensis]PXX60349.1 GIY-YIG catalytic domain-containing protein [Nocardia tenerifensis]
MSSHGKASLNDVKKAPKRSELPAADVQNFRALLKDFLSARDSEGRVWADAKWGVYAFYDYDGEPIYVGQTNEQLRVRVQRHLTNQRTDAVAMRILDTFEVAEVEIWPLWEYQNIAPKRKDPECFVRALYHLNQCEYTVYLDAINNSKYKAILNEKIPPVSPRCILPPSLRKPLISERIRHEREHPDIRIARRAEAISRLAAVARERGEVSPGLRRALVVQAVRLTYLSAQRLAYVEGRREPEPTAIKVSELVGSVLEEVADTDDGQYAEDNEDDALSD